VTTLPEYELIGPPDAPLFVVLGGISASRHVAAHRANQMPGWWDAMVGRARAIDTDRVRVLGVDYLDGDSGDDGWPRRTVTTQEQADAIARLLDRLGEQAVHTMIGASYGGMVSLAFAERWPARVARLVVISAPHEPHPMTTALRALERRIVALGIRSGEWREALILARSLAMTTYRTPLEFRERFSSQPLEHTVNDARFPVEEYLRHHGERFADCWTPARFIALSLSADLHRVDPGAIRTRALLVAAEGDSIVPAEQMRALADGLAGPTRLVQLPSKRGHDAFLTEPEALTRLLAHHLDVQDIA
jgi:homoserine O-acetyltransferase